MPAWSRVRPDEPSEGIDMAKYTVIGAYDGDELLIFGAIEGSHQVQGETQAWHGMQTWADGVEASNAQEACEKAAGR